MTSAAQWVTRYLAGTGHLGTGHLDDIDRVITEPSGLDAHGILEVLADPRLGRTGIHAMSDLMRPNGSMYYDAIYGAFHGQVAIRNWLIPTMALIDFVEFVPTQAGEVYEHADGTASSIDEWQMWAVFGDDRIPLPRGVSTRHYADGWITWNADVYDTAPFRVPPPDGTEAPPLPPPPSTTWDTTVPRESPLSAAAAAYVDRVNGGHAGRDHPGLDHPGLDHADIHALIHHPVHGASTDLVTSLMHPDAVYLDPLFGDFTGRAAIHAWLSDVMPKIGNVRFDHVGPVLFNGSSSTMEWVQMAIDGDGRAHPMFRGTSVRRYADGWITYAADYFDTAVLGDPAIATAGRLAGSTLGPADLARYRP